VSARKAKPPTRHVPTEVLTEARQALEFGVRMLAEVTYALEAERAENDLLKARLRIAEARLAKRSTFTLCPPY
jgi:hypothetical protein